MTTVINLYGGPGTGKSTSAAYLFAQLKMRGRSAELVAEYAKTWAWQDRKIGQFDQFYLLGKQIHHESRLFDKVDYIVTDSPVELCAVYAERYNTPAVAGAIATAVGSYYMRTEELGHSHIAVRLMRSKPRESSSAPRSRPRLNPQNEKARPRPGFFVFGVLHFTSAMLNTGCMANHTTPHSTMNLISPPTA